MQPVVGAVDLGNDLIRRYVVWWYAYDPERHQRRNQVVAAVDKKREFMRLINSLNEDLQRRRAAGESVDPREHYGGVVLEPGHLARAKNGHLLKSAMKRAQKYGTPIPEALFALPSDIGVLRAVRVDHTDGEAEAT